MKKFGFFVGASVVTAAVAVVTGVARGSNLPPVFQRRPMGVLGVSRRYATFVALAEADGWPIDE
ncbi:hypothetical protein GII36_03305 [Candidatus Mycosynbacter amalyticus]|uniref:Uncharacterized protein n=1 Tax=Candidatus Mycosynbacter amalyticus TaxID=2665156 RepID=A0A857MTY5_9BACT|nr:hypothetical protein [Candidatus Mycosynbacter amalyticus]QHN42867.1 hypothetical protein GII36_03305 [Candidatus Mycosynbacter amalyticus]